MKEQKKDMWVGLQDMFENGDGWNPANIEVRRRKPLFIKMDSEINSQHEIEYNWGRFCHLRET